VDEIGSGTMYDNVAWHAWSPPNFPHTDKEAKASYATEALIHGIGKRVDGHFGDELSPRTRFVERPLLRLVNGSFVSSPSTI
jgi:hypothetical protein